MHFTPSQHQTDAIDTRIAEASMYISVITWLQATDACLISVPKGKRHDTNFTED